MNRLVTITLSFAIACGFSSALAQDSAKKHAGPPLDMPPPVQFAPREDLKGVLKPTVRWRVRLKPQGNLPDSLKEKLPPGVSFAPRETKSFHTLENPTLENLRTAINDADVEFVELQTPPTFGRHLPTRPNNRDAALSHNVLEFRTTFAVHGAAITAAVFDEGRVRASHQEFKVSPMGSRIIKTPLATVPLSVHSTHVAGSVGAKGEDPRATGMAPQIKIQSHTWDNDLNVLETEAAGIQVSNHSYGPRAGWDLDEEFGWIWFGRPDLGTASAKEDAQFGKYSDQNAALDDLIIRKPHLSVFVAAGNDRNDGPPEQPIVHWALVPDPSGILEFKKVSTEHHVDGHDHGGFDTVAGLGLSKNAICIGAVHDINPAAPVIATTGFSSWGPTDDGRIKPDLVANGQQLLSTATADDAAYTILSGTSMASPVACGCGALVAEYFKTKKNRDITAAEMKAILIHSARSPHPDVPGPDYVYGWGAIDALRAGRLIEGGNGEFIRAEDVSKNSSRTLTLKPSPGAGAIRIVATWNDPAGSANLLDIDDPTLSLQNDVDLELIAPDGQTFRPYVLNPATPAAPAATGANRRDNVEVIDATTQAGEWKLKLIGTNFKQGAAQKISLVVSGLVPN